MRINEGGVFFLIARKFALQHRGQRFVLVSRRNDVRIELGRQLDVTAENIAGAELFSVALAVGLVESRPFPRPDGVGEFVVAARSLDLA